MQDPNCLIVMKLENVTSLVIYVTSYGNYMIILKDKFVQSYVNFRVMYHPWSQGMRIKEVPLYIITTYTYTYRLVRLIRMYSGRTTNTQLCESGIGYHIVVLFVRHNFCELFIFIRSLAVHI